MNRGMWILAVCVWSFSAGLAWAQTTEPDLWPVVAGDPIETYLDCSLFDHDSLPPGIEAVLDRQGDLAVVNVSQVEGLVDGSSHLLDFGGNKAHHIRPWQVLASARLSPDRTRIAAVLSEPFDHAIVIYSIDDGLAHRLAGVQAAAGSVNWLDAGRLEYLPWVDGQPGSQPAVVDLSTAEYVPPAICPTGNRVVPMVACCGGTCDSYICGAGNPYPCCTNGGNCTWWAWDRACRNWVVALPGWGNAHSWIRNARQDGYTISDVPVIGSIACDSNNTLGPDGHVCWVLSYTSTQITVSEQNCCTGCGYGDRIHTWDRSIFEGYILNPNPPQPPQITQQPQPQVVCPGASATFTVAATGGTPMSYQWQKNGSDLTNGGHYSGVNLATMTVSSAAAADVADYRCVVTNSVDSVTSNTASLTLKAATSITQQPQSVYDVVSGSTVSFTVTATGAGTVTYQWQKNSANLTNGGRISGATSSALQITGVDGTDAAAYRCLVAADCGSLTSKEAVLSFGPPPIPGDFDGDRDVDLEDFGVFQACLTDPQGSISGPPCDQADLNSDGLVDGTDLGLLIGCMSGPHVTGNPDCIGH